MQRVGDLDRKALERTLDESVEGEVRFRDGDRALYSTDGSNYRQIPLGVVIPKTTDDVVATIAACREVGAPVLARGGGTSLAGQRCNVAVVLDFSKYLNRILDIDPSRKVARVEPGAILDDLRTEATKSYGLTFAPDPSTHTHCTIGGMIGNNSCGVHSVLAGRNRARTSDNVGELDVLTYDGTRMTVGATSEERIEEIVRAGGRRGEIYARTRALRDRYAPVIRDRYPDIPRRVSGYNLDDLLPDNGFHVARALAGSEGTLATILEATVELIEWPKEQVLVVLGYPDVYSAGDHVPEILEHEPMGLEGMDGRLVQMMKQKHLHEGSEALLPDGDGWLLVEFGGETTEEADAKARALIDALNKRPHAPAMRSFSDKEQQHAIWAVRESGLGATAYSLEMGDAWPGWEDSAVPPDKIGHYLRDLRKLFDRYGYNPALYGHFGQGCVHCRVSFDLKTAEGIDKYRRFIYDAAHLVQRYGGSISGEHGDGQARGELLPIMFGDELVDAFGEFKSIWDPDWKMNPGKVVDPYRADEHLKLGTDYRPRPVTTHFSFKDEGGSFAHAALRCVGVGKCRRQNEGTMCPSYQVTLEEKHTTRGRARVLFELMRGDPVAKGWRDDYVHEALDLCLACKGCKGECPVSVDMASYKAEFYSHYYKRRLRPRQAYALGLIFWWARLASHAPAIANFAARAPVLSTALKRLAGVAPDRAAPTFATQTLRSWFESRERVNHRGPQVVVWPDTFTNFFEPQVGQAAVRVLEAAGYEVVLPDRILCCGRPLYDFGMLDLAQRLLRQTLDVLRPHISAGTFVVGLEPSCVAVFRDEMTNLFPKDQDALRLREQFCTLAEFLKEKNDYRPPKLEYGALIHPHCHQQAVVGMDADEHLLTDMGLDFEMSDAGCCGLAGSFGFEAGEKYRVSVAAAERKLLPKVRATSGETLLLADGFSCRTQIEQLSGRPPCTSQRSSRWRSNATRAERNRDVSTSPSSRLLRPSRTHTLGVGSSPGPAEHAGLRPGDIILSLGGQPLETVEDFLAELRSLEPGDEVEVEIERDGDQKTVSVRLGEREESE